MLARLPYHTTRVPDMEILRATGLETNFRELCQQGQLTRLFLEPGPPSYHRLTMEFLSTLTIEMPREEIVGLTFQMRNERFEMSTEEFNEIFGFTGTVCKEPWLFRGRVNEFWKKHTGDRTTTSSASICKSTMIRNPVLRMLQKACTCYPFTRKEQDSVHRGELFILWTILHNQPPLNMGHLMIKHLDRTDR